MVSIQEIPSLIITLVLIALVGGVGAFLLSDIRRGMDSTDDFSISNETLVGVSNTTNLTLAFQSISTLTSILVYNNSAGDELIQAGNYSITPIGPLLDGDAAVSFTFQLTPDIADTHLWQGQNLNISYSGTNYDTRGDIFLNGTRGISNLSAQMPTVGTIIGVGLIIGIIAVVFMTIRSKRREY